MRLVECVPNFSEGRREAVINAIVESIEKTSGVRILNLDINKSANRTVVTFAGTPEDVLLSAYEMIETAGHLIDMKMHAGEHPRIGATDVCPIVPLSDVSMKKCVELSHSLASGVGRLLEIPVYLYANSASSKERVNLSFIRAGQYEALPNRMKNEGLLPDYGLPEFNPHSGATVIGARDLLIGFNINIDAPSREIAAQIASVIRDSSGVNTAGSAGTGLKHCRAIGWYINEYGCAQVSTNLMNYKVTPMHAVFEAVSKQAQLAGVKVTGSELIGLAPLEAILESGKFYSDKATATEAELIQYAINGMGLGACQPFNPRKKILDFCLEDAFGTHFKIHFGSK